MRCTSYPLRSTLGALVLLALGSAARAQTPDAAITAAVDGFYGAIKAGDAAKAMSYIAMDAVFIESGTIETREQYESAHLPADIEFEKDATGKRGPLQITRRGDAAWIVSETDYDGFVVVQLVVMSLEDGRWSIRAIHWSSRS